ncbi:MAG: ABC transporter substrate-binding protein [Rhodocyclales bacterium]|nr:ABC transporter substrate-binding protein [Rhodocyclales bacterium]
MKWMSSGSVLRNVLFGALLVVAAAGAEVGAAEETIKIGLSGPLSGGSAPMGTSMRNGIRLAVEEINQFVGGVNGKKIELLEFDDQANNDKGRAIAEAFVNEHKVTAAIGVVNTGVGLNSIDVYQKARVPLMVAVSTGSQLTLRYAPPASSENFVFRVSPPTTVSTSFFARHLLKRAGFKRIALLADDTGYGTAEMTDFVAALKRDNIEPVVIERFPIGARDMRAQLGRARAADADVVMMFGIGPELAAIVRNKAEMGWTVPVYGGWTVSMRNFLDAAGPAGEGVFTVASFIPTSQNMRHRFFVKSYLERFGKDAMESAMSAAQGYDAMRLLYNGLALADDLSGDSIRLSLERLGGRVGRGVEGVVTTYTRPFTPEDHDAITENMLVIGVVRNGRVDYAFEEDARQSHGIRHKRAE